MTQEIRLHFCTFVLCQDLPLHLDNCSVYKQKKKLDHGVQYSMKLEKYRTEYRWMERTNSSCTFTTTNNSNSNKETPAIRGLVVANVRRMPTRETLEFVFSL